MKHRPRAFTLVEILVALAVMGALSLVLHRFLRFSTASHRRSSHRGLILDEAQRVFLHLCDALPRATVVERPAFGDSGNELVYTDGEGRSWQLRLLEGKLLRRESFGLKEDCIAEGISSFRLQRESQDLLLLLMGLAQGKEEMTFRSCFYLRAARRPLVDVGDPGGLPPAAEGQDPELQRGLLRLEALLGLLRQAVPE